MQTNEVSDSKSSSEAKALKNHKDILNEIQHLKQKIGLLELTLEQGDKELRVPKSFPGVKFLNYKDRKRILVVFFFS